MKKMLTGIIVFSLLSVVSFAQQPAKYGLGFEFHMFPSTSFPGLSAIGLYFPIDMNGLLIEPQVVYNNNEEELDYDGGENYSSYDSKTETTDYQLLVGIFKCYEKDKYRFYGGVRMGKVWHEEKYRNDNPDYDDGSDDEEFGYFIIAPTVGTEYFFSENFSFGGEGQLRTMESESQDNYSNTVHKTKTTTLISNFMVRFYF